MGAGSWYATWHGIGSDFTCIGLWHQNHVYEELELFQGKDLMATAGRLKSLPEAIKPQTIVVDDAGLGGGVVDRLREQSVAVIAFNGGEAAQSKDKYYNRRAESYWSPRGSLQQRRSIHTGHYRQRGGPYSRAHFP